MRLPCAFRRARGGRFVSTPSPSPSPTPTPTPSSTLPKFFRLTMFNVPQNVRAAQASGTVGTETWPARPGTTTAFADVAALGCNTVMGCDGSIDPKTWDAQAAAAGLKTVRNPLIQFNNTFFPGRGLTYGTNVAADLAYDIANTNLIAWQLQDEPDLSRGGQACVDYVNAQIAALGASKDAKPLFQNLVGENIAWNIYTSQSGGVFTYQQLLNIADIDLWGDDWYVDQSGQAYQLLQHPSWDYTDTHLGQELHSYITGWYNYALGNPAPIVTTAASGKPASIHISVGRFDTYTAGGATYVTPPDSFEWQFWDAIISGASEIVYFPQGIPGTGGFNSYYYFGSSDYDTIRTVTMPNCHANLALLTGAPQGNLLMDTVNGGRRPFTYYPMQKTTTDPNGASPTLDILRAGQMPFPFKAAEITLGGETYRIILNCKRSTQTLTYAPWGLSGVSFGSLKTKCFKASAPTTNIFS